MMPDGWDEFAVALAGAAPAPLSASAMTKLETIIDRTARSLGLSLDDLTRPDRRKFTVKVRNIAMAEARAAGYSLAAIGRAVDRDHSTVLHGIRSLPTYALDHDA